MNRNKAGLTVTAAILGFIIFTVIQGSWNGGELFKREGCYGCHSFKGIGGQSAPDLTAVSNRRSTIWITEQIRVPRNHNPDSMMPAYTDLSIIERLAIAEFLKR